MTEEMRHQLDDWWETDQHEKIIAAVLAVPEKDRDYDMLGRLAVAYNNTDRLEEAVEVLMSTAEEGRNHYKWHYRMGYALYYLGRPRKALAEFRKTISLYEEQKLTDSERLNEYLTWISRCEEAINMD